MNNSQFPPVPFTVVLPTYNERENLERFVERVKEVFAAHELDGRIIVVDDNSPDGTGQIADTLAERYPNLSVIHRQNKQGIGPAYLAGFRQALSTDTRLIFEMDCDFSHDPANIPAFLKAAEDADLVLGSRYVPGGRVENWGLVRRLISRWGGLYARMVLGVPVNDLTGGNKCFRRQVLESLDLDSVSSQGYGFQIEMTYRTIKKGFRVKEIPITFSDRQRGQSKMSKKIVFEAVLMVWKLRLGSS
ncbi:MAG: polyprenol monophosphomannose synthase [Actinobacteria bacterium]|nr:polyprenol monophosphomannose synthase [Actinomycetota bacterium]